MTRIKDFASPGGTILVSITTPDIIDREPRVTVSWPSVGAVSTDDASLFVDALGEALHYAWQAEREMREQTTQQEGSRDE